jgi:hypothetical protein
MTVLDEARSVVERAQKAYRAERVQMIRANVLAYWRRADPSLLAEGMYWYPLVGQQIRAVAESHGIPFLTACGVTAALSPDNSWSRNFIGLGLAIQAYRNGGRTGAAIPASANRYIHCRDKAMAILCGGDPLWVLGNYGGKTDAYKTRRFHRNLSGDLSVVTVDRHYLQVCMGAWEDAPYPLPVPHGLKVAGALYLDCEEGTIGASEELGIWAAMVQSGEWTDKRKAMY